MYAWIHWSVYFAVRAGHMTFWIVEGGRGGVCNGGITIRVSWSIRFRPEVERRQHRQTATPGRQVVRSLAVHRTEGSQGIGHNLAGAYRTSAAKVTGSASSTMSFSLTRTYHAIHSSNWSHAHSRIGCRVGVRRSSIFAPRTFERSAVDRRSSQVDDGHGSILMGIEFDKCKASVRL